MNNELTFNTYEYVIGGKMVVGRATLSESYRMMMENGDSDAIKNVKMDLSTQLAKFMVENNLVEFTYQDDPFTLNRQIAVRAYIAPNDQVKILRLANKII